MSLLSYILLAGAGLFLICVILSVLGATIEIARLKMKYKGLEKSSIKINYFNGSITSETALYRKLRDDLNIQNSSTYRLVTSSVCFTSGPRDCKVIYDSKKFKDNATPLGFLNQVLPFITEVYIDEYYPYVIIVGEGLIFEPLHIQRSQYDEYTYLLRNGNLDKAVKSAILKLTFGEFWDLSVAYREMTHIESCDE